METLWSCTMSLQSQIKVAGYLAFPWRRVYISSLEIRTPYLEPDFSKSCLAEPFQMSLILFSSFLNNAVVGRLFFSFHKICMWDQLEIVICVDLSEFAVASRNFWMKKWYRWEDKICGNICHWEWRDCLIIKVSCVLRKFWIMKAGIQN